MLPFKIDDVVFPFWKWYNFNFSISLRRNFFVSEKLTLCERMRKFLCLREREFERVRENSEREREREFERVREY